MVFSVGVDVGLRETGRPISERKSQMRLATRLECLAQIPPMGEEYSQYGEQPSSGRMGE